MRVAFAIWLVSAFTLIVCAAGDIGAAADTAAALEVADNAIPKAIPKARAVPNARTSRCPPRVVKRNPCPPRTARTCPPSRSARTRIVHGSTSARYTPPPPPPPPLSVLKDPAPTVSRTVRSAPRTTPVRPVARTPRNRGTAVYSASRVPPPPPPPSLRAAPRTVSRPASRPSTRIAGTPVPPPASSTNLTPVPPPAASTISTPVPARAVAPVRRSTPSATRTVQRTSPRPTKARKSKRSSGGLLGGSGRPKRDGIGLDTLRFLDRKTGGSGCLGGT